MLVVGLGLVLESCQFRLDFNSHNAMRQLTPLSPVHGRFSDSQRSDVLHEAFYVTTSRVDSFGHCLLAQTSDNHRDLVPRHIDMESELVRVNHEVSVILARMCWEAVGESGNTP